MGGPLLLTLIPSLLRTETWDRRKGKAENLDQLREVAEKRRSPFERVFLSRLLIYFAGQRKRVLDAIRQNPVLEVGETVSLILPRREDEARRYIKEIWATSFSVAQVFGQSTVDEFLNSEDESRSFDAYWASLFSLEDLDSDLITILASDVGVSFDVYDPVFFSALQDRLNVVSGRVNNTTFRKLVPTLSEGYRNGESIADLSQRVQTVFGGTTRALPWRARMIARTEVNGAANTGTFFGAWQTGVIDRKQWLTARDEKVRQPPKSRYNHAAAEGEEVSLISHFTRTGEALMYPGDVAGSPGNIINCRCTTILIPIGFGPTGIPGVPGVPGVGTPPRPSRPRRPPKPPPIPPVPPTGTPPRRPPKPTAPPVLVPPSTPSPPLTGLPVRAERPPQGEKEAYERTIAFYQDRSVAKTGERLKRDSMPKEAILFSSEQDMARRFQVSVDQIGTTRGLGDFNTRVAGLHPAVAQHFKSATQKEDFRQLSRDEVWAVKTYVHEIHHVTGSTDIGRTSTYKAVRFLEEGFTESSAQGVLSDFMTRQGWRNVPAVRELSVSVSHLTAYTPETGYVKDLAARAVAHEEYASLAAARTAQMEWIEKYALWEGQATRSRNIASDIVRAYRRRKMLADAVWDEEYEGAIRRAIVGKVGDIGLIDKILKAKSREELGRLLEQNGLEELLTRIETRPV